MTDNTPVDTNPALPFKVHHAQLLRIAAVANTFTWIIFVVNLLFVFGRLTQEISQFDIYRTMRGAAFRQTFWEMLIQNPLFSASLFLDMLSIFLNGLVLALVLKGIALGLTMIVETDMNYREKSQGELDE